MEEPILIKVTRPIPEAGLKLLRDRGYELDIHPDKVMAKNQLMEFVQGATGILSMLTEKIDGDVMDAAGPNLKIISQFTVGYDNIDLDAAKKRGIVVTNTAGSISAPAVAEHAVALMFAVARHIPEADEFSRKGKYKQWDPNLFLGPLLCGKTVGIIGTGQIGSQFARMCHNGFRMKVVYSDVVRNKELERDLGAHKVEIEKLLREADVVSLHTPLLPATHHLMNKERFGYMKPTAILINTARGPVVDEAALTKALANGTIAGAGIDVFEHEPEISPELTKMPNVIITPHIASATMDTRVTMAECTAKNLVAYFSTGEPLNRIV